MTGEEVSADPRLGVSLLSQRHWRVMEGFPAGRGQDQIWVWKDHPLSLKKVKGWQSFRVEQEEAD